MSKVALALAAALTLGGCGEHARLEKAGIAIGTANAGVTMPDLPSDCRRQFGHAKVRVGYEASIALKKERGIVDAANKTISGCAEHYDEVKAALAGKPEESRAAPPQP